MTNCTIKRCEQPAMGRRYHDEMSTCLKVRDGALQLSAVVLDVLEDINVDNGIELLLARKLRQRTNDNLAPRRNFP